MNQLCNFLDTPTVMTERLHRVSCILLNCFKPSRLLVIQEYFPFYTQPYCVRDEIDIF